MSQNPTLFSLSQSIDHTLLKPEATRDQIFQLCDEAMEYSVKTVCIEARWLEVVVPRLASSSVLPITVVAFPGGEADIAQRSRDARYAVELGAKEVDVVLNRKFLKKRDFRSLQLETESVVEACGKIPLKVILETSELTREEIAMACAICKLAGAAFVKTSTGFSKGGARVEDVALMRECVGPEMGVKASGGIKTLADALSMLSAGANRLGCSATVSILKEAAAKGL